MNTLPSSFYQMLSRISRMRQGWCLRLRVKEALALRVKQVWGWHLRVTPAYPAYLTIALAQVLGKDVSRRIGTLAQGEDNFFFVKHCYVLIVILFAFYTKSFHF